MLFSSLVFLYLFLPLTLLGYYVIKTKYRNYWLLLASFIFFAWGGVSYTAILIISIVLNYYFGIKVQKYNNSKMSYRWLSIGVATNLLILGVFKYANFFVENLNNLFYFLSIPAVPELNVVLPIGISFYTFHSLSYLIDIYRRKTLAQRNIFNLSLYIAMFSQLIAGPIIRYSDVYLQLKGRKHTLAKFSSGVERFLIGLAKKVLLANTFARIADELFAADPAGLGGLNAWLGIISYTFQIYCDFAGYSDMAIGLGRMFGFHFQENFNYPYLAKSVKEFWRRWHISLSSFFRDYLYIPLGGNRISPSRTYLNLLIVFFLTGFWHGASWVFVLWGLFHGFFMMIERIGLEKILNKTWKPIAITYNFLVVMFAWVLFRSDTLHFTLNYWKEMFNFNSTKEQYDLFLHYINIEFIGVFMITVLGSFGIFKYFGKQIERIMDKETNKAKIFSYGFHLISIVFYIAIVLLCTMYLTADTYNPFIYYRF